MKSCREVDVDIGIQQSSTALGVHSLARITRPPMVGPIDG